MYPKIGSAGQVPVNMDVCEFQSGVLGHAGGFMTAGIKPRHHFNDLADLHDATMHFAAALGRSQLPFASRSGICCVRVIQF